MSRYPTDSRGLAIPIQEIGYEVMEFERRKTSRHHLYFYRRLYQGGISQIFRGLLPHVQTMTIADHTELHREYSPPKQPNRHLMIDVIEEYLSLNGIIDVVNEHRTCDTYQLTAEQWGGILNGRRQTS